MLLPELDRLIICEFENVVNDITTNSIHSAFFLPFSLIVLVSVLPNSAVGAPALSSDTNTILDTGPRLTGHTGWINSVRFSPDGKIIVTGSLGGTTKLWDVETGRELHSVHETVEDVATFRFSPDGSVLASGRDDGTIELRDPTTGKLIRRLRNDFTSTFALAFSPDGKQLASGHRSGTVHLWKVETGNHLGRLEAHEQNVSGLTFSPNKNRLVTAAHGGSVKSWNPTTGEKIANLSTDTIPITVISFSPGGRHLIWGGRNGELVARDMSVDPPRNRPFAESAGDVVETIRFDPGGDRMVSGSRDGTVKIWDPKTGRTLRAIKNKKWSVYTMVLAPDGILMGGIDGSTGGYDGLISRWSVRSGSSP